MRDINLGPIQDAFYIHVVFIVNDKSSSHSRITSGEPQGSVLGPILFTIYMVDIG